MNKPVNRKSTPGQGLASALGILGALLIFAFILYIAYLPNRPRAVDQDRIAERYANRRENDANQQSRATSYEWIDREEGIVRIPIDRAMILVVDQWQQK